MALMVFKYSAMNGGKTLNILQTAHNYEENNFITSLSILENIKIIKEVISVLIRY